MIEIKHDLQVQLQSKSFIKCIKIYVSTNKIHMAAEHEQEEQNLLQFWQVEDTAIGLSLM